MRTLVALILLALVFSGSRRGPVPRRLRLARVERLLRMDEAGTGRHRRRASSGATTSADVVCDGSAVAVERRRRLAVVISAAAC